MFLSFRKLFKKGKDKMSIDEANEILKQYWKYLDENKSFKNKINKYHG